MKYNILWYLMQMRRNAVRFYFRSLISNSIWQIHIITFHYISVLHDIISCKFTFWQAYLSIDDVPKIKIRLMWSNWEIRKVAIATACTPHQTMYDENDEDNFVTWFASYFVQFVSFLFIISCELRPYKLQAERIHWYTTPYTTHSVTVTFLVTSCDWTEGKKTHVKAIVR